jgi:hypothetical protein
MVIEMAETAARTGDMGRWALYLEKLCRINHSHPVGKVSHMPLCWRDEEGMIQREGERKRETEQKIERRRVRNLEGDRV